MNLNDSISSNDATQIMWLSTQTICEFIQTWNYWDSLGIPVPQVPYWPSLDWRFIDSSTVASAPGFVPNGLYPFDDPNDADVGYFVNDVPDVPFCFPVNTGTGLCPIVEDEAYHGILVGDVDGNWQGNTPPVALKADLNGKIVKAFWIS